MDTPRDIIAARRYVIDRFHRKNCAPTVVIDMDVEIGRALTWIEGLNAARLGGAEVTLTHAVLKATAMGLREHIFYNYGYNGQYRIVPHDGSTSRSRSKSTAPPRSSSSRAPTGSRSPRSPASFRRGPPQPARRGRPRSCR